MLDNKSKWHYNNAMVRYSLRVPKDLWTAIQAIAKQEQRSINAQILYILLQFVEQFNKKQG